MRNTFFLLGFLCMAAYSWAATEIEYFDDAGTSVVKASGELIEESTTDLVLKTESEELRIPVFRIESIKYDGQPPALLNVRNLESQRRYEDAIKEYEGILATIDKEAQPYLHAAVTAAMFQNLADWGMIDETKLKPAIEWYEKNGEALSSSRHFYPMAELAGRLYMSAGDFTKAEESFTKLRGVNWPGYKEKALIYQGLASLRQDKPVDAILNFDDVLKSTTDSPVVLEQKRIAKIAKADALVKSNKAAEAEKLCRESVDELSAEEKEDLLAKARNTLGDALAAQQKDKEAVLDGYMWVHVLYNGDQNEHARAVYNLSLLFEKIGYPDRAQQMAELLKSTFGQSEWAKKSAGS